MSTDSILHDLTPPPPLPEFMMEGPSAEFQARMAVLLAQLQAQLEAMVATLNATAASLLPLPTPFLPPVLPMPVDPLDVLPSPPMPVEDAWPVLAPIGDRPAIAQPKPAEWEEAWTMRPPEMATGGVPFPEGLVLADLAADLLAVVPQPAMAEQMPAAPGATVTEPLPLLSWPGALVRHGDCGEGAAA